MFTTSLIFLAPFIIDYAFAAAMIRATSPAVLHDYEDIDFTSAVFLIQAQSPPDPYKQLHYDEFRVASREPAEQVTIRTRGTGVAIGNNASSITSEYTGSAVRSFKPESAAFACFVATRTSYVPRVTCNIITQAFKRGGAMYDEVVTCSYDGGPEIQDCTFHGLWTEVERIEFEIVPTGFFEPVLNSLYKFLLLLGVDSLLAAGRVTMYLDDFSARYNCDTGYVNGAAGLCDVCAPGYYKASDGRCLRSQ